MSNGRRIRFVTPRYGDVVVGGTETLVRRLAGALAARTWDVEVWSTDALDEATWTPSDAFADQSVDDGVTVKRWHVGKTRNAQSFATFSRAFFRMPADLRPESMWLKRQGPYVPQLIDAILEAAAVPTVFSPYLYYTTVAVIPKSPHPRILMPAAHDELPLALRCVRRAVTEADGFMFHTPEEMELFFDRFPEAGQKPHAVGTVGLELDKRDAKPASRGEPYLYFGGRVTPGKGIEYLLGALQTVREKHPQLRLVVTGPASDDPVFAGNAGVDCRGLVNLDDRTKIIGGALATVVPGALESLSMIALESWAECRPCIVNSNSPTLAGQAERSGGAVAFRHQTELALAVERLIMDPELADELGKRGFDYVTQNYRWDDVVSRLENLIAECRT